MLLGTCYMLPKKTFTKNNQNFTCINCGKEVEKHPTSSRDHCNHCLYGVHVDINPGDRMNECKGLLKPVGLKIGNRKTQIVYECRACFEKVFCISALDDNKDEILKLVGKIWEN